MANKRIDVIMIKQILHLKNKGKNKAEVAAILKINRETVRKYWNNDSEENSGPEIKKPDWAISIPWDKIKEEVKTGVSRKILYDELKENHILPSYSNFCRYLNIETEVKSETITIRIHRRPGESVEIDYSGDTFPIIIPSTGEIIQAHLFVGVLSYSSYTYAEFTLSESLDDFISAHNGMFFYFGGVPSYLIPDNCKTAVISFDKYDPQLNKTYRDLSAHYGVAIDPARPAHPRDKPHVERAVGIIQNEFFKKYRNKTFTSLRELNRELYSFLDELNRRIIRERGKSRLQLLEEERSFLSSLPIHPYEIFYFKKAKLHPDCHIQHQRNFYSAPYSYVGKTLIVKYNNKMIYLYSETQLIATHTALKGHGHYSTNQSHYPEKKVVDLHMTILTCKNDARKIGPNTYLLIDKILTQAKYPLKNLRKVQGIIGLGKLFSNEAMEYAAEAALEHNRLFYQFIKDCAKNYKPLSVPISNRAPARDIKLICLQGEKLC